MLHARTTEARNESMICRRATTAALVTPRVAPLEAGNQALLRASTPPDMRPSHVPVLQRQCACGGTCPSCKDQATKLQTKIAINEPGDAYEQEADRVADQVMRMPAPAAHKKAEIGSVQRNSGRTATSDGAPPIVGELARSPGQPLDAETRAFMEPRFGADFGAVRVHADSRAAQSANAVNAQAYTVGRDIVFAGGQYSPTSTAGRRLLAHELTHTLQQDPGRLAVSPIVLRQQEESRLTPPDVSNTGGGSSGESSPGIESQQLSSSSSSSSSSSGSGGGGPSPAIPDCSAVMGGRQVDHWLAGSILGMNHTYVNFKEDASHYWLVEAGPLPSDPHHVGAWAKAGDWESRGNRIVSKYSTPEICATAKAALFAAQSTYHSMTLPYDPSNGPNSNSFTEHVSTKTPFFPSFISADWKWDYWKSHARPF